MNTSGYYLGLDLGSVSLDGVIIDESNKIHWHAYRKVQGCSRDAVASLCKEILDEWMYPWKISSFKGVLATGSGKEHGFLIKI